MPTPAVFDPTSAFGCEAVMSAAKIPLVPTGKSILEARRLALIRRGGRVVTNVERGMRWPQIVSPDERCGLRTVKSCGLDASTLALTR
jgi:hypothetical protein